MSTAESGKDRQEAQSRAALDNRLNVNMSMDISRDSSIKSSYQDFDFGFHRYNMNMNSFNSLNKAIHIDHVDQNQSRDYSLKSMSNITIDQNDLHSVSELSEGINQLSIEDNNNELQSLLEEIGPEWESNGSKRSIGSSNKTPSTLSLSRKNANGSHSSISSTGSVLGGTMKIETDAITHTPEWKRAHRNNMLGMQAQGQRAKPKKISLENLFQPLPPALEVIPEEKDRLSSEDASLAEASNDSTENVLQTKQELQKEVQQELQQEQGQYEPVQSAHPDTSLQILQYKPSSVCNDFDFEEDTTTSNYSATGMMRYDNSMNKLDISGEQAQTSQSSVVRTAAFDLDSDSKFSTITGPPQAPQPQVQVNPAQPQLVAPPSSRSATPGSPPKHNLTLVNTYTKGRLEEVLSQFNNGDSVSDRSSATDNKTLSINKARAAVGSIKESKLSGSTLTNSMDARDAPPPALREKESTSNFLEKQRADAVSLFDRLKGKKPTVDPIPDEETSFTSETDDENSQYFLGNQPHNQNRNINEDSLRLIRENIENFSHQSVSSSGSMGSFDAEQFRAQQENSKDFGSNIGSLFASADLPNHQRNMGYQTNQSFSFQRSEHNSEQFAQSEPVAQTPAPAVPTQRNTRSGSRMKQITPQEFAKTQAYFQNNSKMEYDDKVHAWVPRTGSVSSTLAREASTAKQSSVRSSTKSRPLSNVNATQLHISDQNDADEDDINFSSSFSRSPPMSPEVSKLPNGSLRVSNNTAIQSTEQFRPPTSSPLSSMSSSQLNSVNSDLRDFYSSGVEDSIVKNKSFKKPGKTVTIDKSFDKSFDKENSSVSFGTYLNDTADMGGITATNVSMIQTSYSNALKQTVDIVSRDKYGRVEQKRLEYSSENKLTNTLWLGKIHPYMEQLDAPGLGIVHPDGLPTTLYSLNLENNQVSDVGTNFGKLVNLGLLNLKGNGITNCAFLAPLINLRKLNLSDNSISNLTGIKDIKTLQLLDVSNNELSGALDLTGTAWRELTHLYLSGNRNLTSVTLNPDNKIVDLRVDDCVNLKLIEGTTAKLVRLHMSRCTKLTCLNFKDNYPRLQILKCNENPQIKEVKDGYVPHTLISASFTHQTKDFAKNLLPFFTSLQRLRLDFTPISKDDLDLKVKFFDLHVLHLNNCGIQELPESFGKVFLNLRELFVRNNRLKDITPLRNIELLFDLDLRGNIISKKQFVKALETLVTLSSLLRLDLRDNPLTMRLYEDMNMNEADRQVILQVRDKYREHVKNSTSMLVELDGVRFDFSHERK